ncbi:STAS domain-containing protein [Sphingomonadaceae bacterium G21617-S1]|jgi:anti-anti-sigma factor|uniref:STAS domain-containing protein n=1 Tax=Rhizorhabdus sp. TaxID=1968843 RepID=UPI00121AA11B|nr:STAS domain-containing protein [Rhizorhabdus sp.]MBD3760365.1 STAS domain-containing protein [Rhizorhabdus sp.]MCZ4340103.1 STAS domain-containing protein [Sphingomonadaceae bacterium G21617-S1]TAK10177.1 MAG: anti-sigma factor antagonist [Rhizorhabdus sp.]
MIWAASSSTRGPVGHPAGDIDDGARDVFLGHLRDGVAQAAAGPGDFVIDLSAVDHMSAAALMALTIARKEAINSNVKIVLARPTPALREVLEISRYQLIFDIVDHIDGNGV